MENKIEQIFKTVCSADCGELDLSQLSEVSGGVIDKNAESKLIEGIKLAKTLGVSLNEVLQQVPSYYSMLHAAFPNVTQDEAINFIKKNWNKY